MLISYSKGELPLVKYHHHYLLSSKVALTSIYAGDSFMRCGCGKSYTAMRTGELVDKSFGIHKVVYTPQDFLKVMDEVEREGTKGQVVVVDEGEITAPAHLWQDFRNRAIGYSLATGRYLQCLTIVVSPSFGWVDKRLRTLTNHLGFCNKIIDSGGKTKVNLRLYRLKTDQFNDKIYLNKINMHSAERNQIITFKSFNVKLPSEALCEEYEKKSRSFKSSLRSDLSKSMHAFDKEKEKEGSSKKDFSELTRNALKNDRIMQMLKDKGKVTANLLKYELASEQLSNNQVSQLKTVIELTWKGK